MVLNKFIISLFLLSSYAWSSDYAYSDKNYAEAEVLYKKYWEKEGKVEHFKAYVKTLIRQKKYEKALEVIQIARIDNDYINVGETYFWNFQYIVETSFKDSRLADSR